MPWNWQLPNWPHFSYPSDLISHLEKTFLLRAGNLSAYLKVIPKEDYDHFVVEILTSEGLKSSKIEGEILDRESLQSSIKKHFGLKRDGKKLPIKERKMAELLCNVYQTYQLPLSHEILKMWHGVLFDGSNMPGGDYRSHDEPMQIISNKYGSPRVFFEAPPSSKVPDEMGNFIHWFNHTSLSLHPLERAAIAHLYFENIHPFEDGNGRIGRFLVEKALSQGVERSLLITVSRILEKRRKQYYEELEKCNKSLDAGSWVSFFGQVVLEAQEESLKLLSFLIEKSKMLNSLTGKLNERQEKVLLRMFAEGPSGFKGGLSAENYIKIAGTSRATATRDLMDLVEKKALKKTGELKHTRYFLNLREL